MSQVIGMNMRQQSKLPYRASTYSKSAVADPLFSALATHADGPYVFVDGHNLLDMVNGLSSVIVGHRHPEIDEAIRRQLTNGTTFSLATRIEHEAAERVLAHFPNDCLLQWAVNGSDATEGACRLARLVTGRSVVLMPHDGYAGFHDFALVHTERGEGINFDSNIVRFRWDYDDPRGAFEELDNVTAAVLIEPDLHPDWLKFLREWCDAHGALLIFDEVVTYGRFPEWTASEHYGVRPDLWCIGKSLANGLPVSGIIGTSDIVRRFAPSKNFSNAFFSSTWAGHPLSMAAVIATLDVMERENGPQKLWRKAQEIHEMLYGLALGPKALKMPKFSVTPPPFNRITWHPSPVAREWRKLMWEAGTLIYNAHFPSLAFDENGMTRLRNAWESVVEVLPEHLDALDAQEEEQWVGRIMRRG